MNILLRCLGVLLLAGCTLTAGAVATGGLPSKPTFGRVTVKAANNQARVIGSSSPADLRTGVIAVDAGSNLKIKTCNDAVTACGDVLVAHIGSGALPDAVSMNSAGSVAMIGNSAYIGANAGTIGIEAMGAISVEASGSVLTLGGSSVVIGGGAAGVAINTSGGPVTVGGNPMVGDVTGSFVWTITGVSVTPGFSSGTAYYSLQGKQACINFINDPQTYLGGTSNSTSKRISGLPSFLNPEGIVTGLIVVRDNSGPYQIGMWQMGMTGDQMELFPAVGGGNWTASGLMSVERFATCWVTD